MSGGIQKNSSVLKARPVFNLSHINIRFICIDVFIDELTECLKGPNGSPYSVGGDQSTLTVFVGNSNSVRLVVAQHWVSVGLALN